MTARLQPHAREGAIDFDQAPGREPAKAAPRSISRSVWAFLILVSVVAAYSPVLFDFFAGDDFVHLTWLKEAIKNPELVWRNFHSSWLDGTTTRFYRPLISVFMVCDYALWGVNGLGFHITNLLCHLASTALVFAIVRQMGRIVGQAGYAGASGWALTAAALFGLYPLHPEAVSWITGRVDSVVTMFCLASLASYMRWRTGKGMLWWLLSGIFMVLGLTSKEMAVTLPVVFAAYEFTLGPSLKRQGPFAAKILLAMLPTLFFWLLLAGYFVVRRMALGTFVGGYDDSLFFISNWGHFVGGWLHAIKMLVVPLNKELISAHSALSKIWQASIVSAAVLFAWTLFRRPALLPAVVFSGAWLVLSLVPVYKIFAITDDLQASRLAYLATAPLCVLIAVAFAGFPLRGRLDRLAAYARALTCALILGAAFCALWTNNQAWRQAGLEANAIRAGLDRLYRHVSGDPQVLLVGLPDNIHGAYTCRNSLWGMTKVPQLHRDVANCLTVDRFEPVLPFGYLKQSLYDNRANVKIFRWDSKGSDFFPITLSSGTTGDATRRWQGAALTSVLKPAGATVERSRWQPDGSLAVSGMPGHKGRPQLILSLPGTPSWKVDFIQVAVKAESPSSWGGVAGADLIYTVPASAGTFDLARRSHCDTSIAQAGGKFTFALRGLPEWSLTGLTKEIELLLPDDCKLTVTSVAVVPYPEMAPLMSFTNSGYMGTKGFIHLSKEKRTEKIAVDALRLPNARAIELAVTRPNLLFEAQNPPREGNVVLWRLRLSDRKGTIEITRDMFPSTGIYELRPWALDAGGDPLGAGGDHVVVSVDS